MTDKDNKEKKPDLGKWEKPEDTVRQRKADRDGLLSAVTAIDMSYNLGVYDELMKRSQKDGKAIADWTYLQEGHKNYDKELAGKVRGMVDDFYDIRKSKYHPLREMFSKEGLDKAGKNHYLIPFLNNVFTAHREEIRKAVSSSRFREQLSELQKHNQQKVLQESLEHAVADIDTDEKRTHVAKFFTDKYGVKPENDQILSQNATQVMHTYMIGGLDEEHLRDYGRVARVNRIG